MVGPNSRLDDKNSLPGGECLHGPASVQPERADDHEAQDGDKLKLQAARR